MTTYPGLHVGNIDTEIAGDVALRYMDCSRCGDRVLLDVEPREALVRRLDEQ